MVADSEFVQQRTQEELADNTQNGTAFGESELAATQKEQPPIGGRPRGVIKLAYEAFGLKKPDERKRRPKMAKGDETKPRVKHSNYSLASAVGRSSVDEQRDAAAKREAKDAPTTPNTSARKNKWTPGKCHDCQYPHQDHPNLCDALFHDKYYQKGHPKAEKEGGYLRLLRLVTPAVHIN
ncbi:unnamed protein product, partial [Mesorhabditis spiculigera]